MTIGKCTMSKNEIGGNLDTTTNLIPHRALFVFVAGPGKPFEI